MQAYQDFVTKGVEYTLAQKGGYKCGLSGIKDDCVLDQLYAAKKAGLANTTLLDLIKVKAMDGPLKKDLDKLGAKEDDINPIIVNEVINMAKVFALIDPTSGTSEERPEKVNTKRGL